MPVTETPILLRADADKNAYRGEAMSQLRILKHEMALGGLTVSARTVRYSNGVIIHCRKSFDSETVDIFIPAVPKTPEELPVRFQPDFATHPRSGAAYKLDITDDISIPAVRSGGYCKIGKTFYAITSYVAYPAVDNDHGTFVLKKKKDTLSAVWAAPTGENYGNCWWENAEGRVLSWKGNPSQQFPIGSAYVIPGLTTKTHDGNTVFGHYIYSGGAILCQGPVEFVNEPELTLVVGACFAKDTDKKLWLVAITVTPKQGVPTLQVWRTDDTGKTWQVLGEFKTLRAAVTAFVHKSGLKFVYGGKLYRLDEAVYRVTEMAAIPVSYDGTRTIHGAGGYGSSYEFAGGVGHCWPSISSNGELVFSTYTESASFTGTGNSDTQNQVVQVPVYRGNPATEVIVRPGYDNGFVFDAEPNGKYCSVQWSGVDRYKGTRAWKAAPKGCNTDFSVSVTLLPQGVVGTYTHNSEQSDMTISGPTTAYVGAQYSTSHAIAPVTWYISSGTIDETGKITELGCNPTITATDFCGRTASITSTGSPITISGSTDAAVGTQYTASNFVGPLTWSIGSGAINSATGVITSVGCGSATITVTDSCGNTATKDVKFPSGIWVLQQVLCPDDPPYGCSCDYLYSTTKYVGNLKKVYCYIPGCHCTETVYSWCRYYAGENNSDLDCAGVTWGCVGDPCTKSVAPYGGAWFTYHGYRFFTVRRVSIYTWECP